MIRSELRNSGHTQIHRFGAGSNDMKRFCASCAIAAVAVLGGGALTAPASAAPPTVTPSPGYDARLQEQRAAAAAAATVIHEPVMRAPKRISRRHAKRNYGDIAN
jgi:hypothetical protein